MIPRMKYVYSYIHLCVLYNIICTGGVRGTLARTTPDDCVTFMVGTVAFVLAPRGPGSGYKTHKRLGAEFKGAQVLRCVMGRAGG